MQNVIALLCLLFFHHLNFGKVHTKEIEWFFAAFANKEVLAKDFSIFMQISWMQLHNTPLFNILDRKVYQPKRKRVWYTALTMIVINIIKRGEKN